ncbi:MAG: hypothetical protein WBC93_07055 [Sulfitobacter sp.]
MLEKNSFEGQVLSEESANQLSRRIDQFGAKYKLWLVIPLMITAAIAVVHLDVAIVFLIFFLVVWGIAGLMLAIQWAVLRIIPPNASSDTKLELRESIGATVFLGSFAIVGIVLRGDNSLSDSVNEHVPDGMSFGFIDPIFAVVCIVGIWIYTVYKIWG